MSSVTVRAGEDVGLVWEFDADLDAGTASLTITDPDSAATVGPTAVGVGAGGSGRYTYVWSTSSSLAAGTYTATLSGEIAAEAVSQAVTVYVVTVLVYETLANVKDDLDLTGTEHDRKLLRALVGASRAVETACGGRSFDHDTVATLRTYETSERVYRRRAGGTSRSWLIVDDISDTGTLTVTADGVALPATVLTAPDNAIARGRPVEAIALDGGSWDSYRRVGVTTKWGWPVTYPDGVVTATRLQSLRLFDRRLSPSGVKGSADWGITQIPRLDPDLMPLVAGFVRYSGG
jgi:hypothetical protein